MGWASGRGPSLLSGLGLLLPRHSVFPQHSSVCRALVLLPEQERVERHLPCGNPPDAERVEEPPALVAVLGANGAGKSTLLKLISRVTAPSSGLIGLNGRVASMLEIGTGFHPELTGRENIYMNGAILGMRKKEIDAKLEDIIAFSECRQFIDTPVKRYSSGMYVKLAFAVAAHLDSEIMVMDEVLAVGDMAFQKKCLDKMNDVSKSQGRTILYVSHNMNTIRQLCKRCIVLDHGKLIYDGDVEEGIRRYINVSEVSFEKSIDLTSASRMKGISRRILFVSAEIQRDNNIYTSHEPMAIHYTLKAEDMQEHVRFMMILFYQDGTRIGKTESGERHQYGLGIGSE